MFRNYSVFLAWLFLPFAPQSAAGQALVCQLGNMQSPFNPAQNQPASPYAVNELGTIYQLLCPNGCGQVSLFLNPTTPNAMAMAVGPGTSMITYEPNFMGQLFNAIGPEASFGVLAHEFGHHVDFHSTPPWMNNAWSRELKADAWAGCALARRGFNPAQISTALRAIAGYPSPSHPSWNLRVPAVQQGFLACGGQLGWLPWAVPGA